MKRNKITKVASIVFALTLITTMMIGGTFAKYVTSAEGTEQKARVAKWGVTVEAGGKLFDETYLTSTNTPNGTKNTANTSKVSVEVDATGINLVAPGTKSYQSTDANVFKFSITGQPEVAVNVSITTNEIPKDVYLSKSSENESIKALKLSSDYKPVVFTLSKKNSSDQYVAVTDAGSTLASIATYLNGLGKDNGSDKVFEPNTNLSDTYGEFIITWEWPIASTASDAADTLLGNIANGTSAGTVDSDYSITESLNMSISVEQVD